MKDVIRKYCKTHGKSFDPYLFETVRYVPDPTTQVIAEHYMSESEMPEDARRVTYDAFKAQLFEQFICIQDSGIRPIYTDSDPYNTYNELRSEFDGSTFRVRKTFTADREDISRTHPMAEVSELNIPYNDIFRFVHDAFTHLSFGLDFSFNGEMNAAAIHARICGIGSISIPALLNETEFQTCAFIFNGAEFASQRVVTVKTSQVL